MFTNQSFTNFLNFTPKLHHFPNTPISLHNSLLFANGSLPSQIPSSSRFSIFTFCTCDFYRFLSLYLWNILAWDTKNFGVVVVCLLYDVSMKGSACPYSMFGSKLVICLFYMKNRLVMRIVKVGWRSWWVGLRPFPRPDDY